MLREYSGNAKATTLNGAVDNVATTVTVSDGTGYPDGATGPFVIAVGVSLASEEKMLCASRIGNSITVTTRGYDGTTAAAHDNGATVQHTYSAVDAREANAHVNATTGAHAATAISNTPAGGIAATTVQAALNELDSEKAATSHTHTDDPNTFRLVHTFTIAGTLAVASGATNYIPPFFVSLPAGQTAVISSARHRIRGGTSATWTLSHGTVDAGTSVTGLTTVASSTTVATTVASGANTLADGDAVQLVITGVSGSPDNLTVSVFLDVTVT